MKIALLGGAGIIGRVIARDLALTGEVDEVIVADLNRDGAQAVVDSLNDRRFRAAAVDVTDRAGLVALLAGADCAINSVQYYFNLEVMRACLEAGCHYLDLGGLFHTTRKQLVLHDAFQSRGLTAILGLGSCPGIANVQAALAAARFDTLEAIKIYNGATTDSADSLAWAYSLDTILDEMTLRPVVFRAGKFVECEPLSEEEPFAFRPPIGTVKTHLSLHSEVATLPLAYAGQGLTECFFKIHFFGYSEAAFRRLQFLTEIGLASTEAVTVRGQTGQGQIETVQVRPREVLLKVLAQSQATKRGENPGFKDIATVVTGQKDGAPLTVRVDTTAWPHPDYGVSGGALGVGVPPAVVARWLAAGQVAATGVHGPETSVDPARFFAALASRRIQTEITVTTEFR
ncbi:MAG: saccharopine dehydrogenase family protein [Anaerolineae bacterium]